MSTVHRVYVNRRLTFAAYVASLAKLMASKAAVENASLGIQGRVDVLMVKADSSLWRHWFQH